MTTAAGSVMRRAARDAAANVGPASAPYTITVDSIAPAVPTISGVFNDVGNATRRVPGGGGM